MSLSGTSISAPAVSGAVALMLQVNPGLTPPLVKAILQYTAMPVPGANLLQQGAGMLNVDGAVLMARLFRTDLASAIEGGRINAGDPLLASGRSLPASRSTRQQAASTPQDWSRMVTVGGNRIVSGDALFTPHQPLWVPRLVWAGSTVLRTMPLHWGGAGVAANTFVRSFSESAPTSASLLTPAVLYANPLLSASSLLGRTGVFTHSTTLARWLATGGGVTFASGLVMSEGLAMSESGGSTRRFDTQWVLGGEP